jgi:hypothetical protein
MIDLADLTADQFERAKERWDNVFYPGYERRAAFVPLLLSYHFHSRLLLTDVYSLTLVCKLGFDPDVVAFVTKPSFEIRVVLDTKGIHGRRSPPINPHFYPATQVPEDFSDILSGLAKNNRRANARLVLEQRDWLVNEYTSFVKLFVPPSRQQIGVLTGYDS